MRVGAILTLECSHKVSGVDEDAHGHTWEVEAVVEGPLKDGMVMDFHDLKAAINGVLERYQRKNLNKILKNPSSEGLAEALHEGLKKALPNLVLLRLRQGKDIVLEIG